MAWPTSTSILPLLQNDYCSARISLRPDPLALWYFCYYYSACASWQPNPPSLRYLYNFKITMAQQVLFCGLIHLHFDISATSEILPPTRSLSVAWFTCTSIVLQLQNWTLPVSHLCGEVDPQELTKIGWLGEVKTELERYRKANMEMLTHRFGNIAYLSQGGWHDDIGKKKNWTDKEWSTDTEWLTDRSGDRLGVFGRQTRSGWQTRSGRQTRKD